jgi:general secretion pathway protein B
MPVTTEPEVERAAIEVAPPSPQPVASAPEIKPGRITESLATFNNLQALGTLNLPYLHLDIHVFSNEPADRFVFVNMSKYKERATLDEGPVVAEITPEGVILDYRGIMFLLPRD